jgi:hypothetical protein
MCKYQGKAYRRAKARHRVPALDGGKAFGPAPLVRPIDDIIEALVSDGVQPRIQEPHRCGATGQQVVVEQGDDAGHHRRRRARPADVRRLLVPGGVEALALSCEIRVASALLVVLERLFRVRVEDFDAVQINVRVERFVLVLWAREDVAEPAPGREIALRIVGRHLRIESLCGTDRRHVWTASWKVRNEATGQDAVYLAGSASVAADVRITAHPVVAG